MVKIKKYAKCQNCGAEWTSTELPPEIPRVFERVAAGEPMPAGECPDCGALCHPATRERP